MFLSATSNVPIEFMPHIGKRTAKVLRSLGVGTIGQFSQLPEQLLIELFGPSIRSAVVDSLVVPTTTAAAAVPLQRSLVNTKRSLPLFKRFQLATQLMTLL